MKLGEILKIYRMIQSIKLKDFAKEIGITHSTLSRLENGRTINGESLSKVLIWLLKESEGS